MRDTSTKPLSILVIDDEQNVCDFLVDFLEYHGYQALSTRSCKRALQILDERHIDLILLDIIMPEMNGLEFLSQLQKYDRKTPVIVITGSKDEHVKEESLRLGAREFIAKPIDLDYLQQKISHFQRDME